MGANTGAIEQIFRETYKHLTTNSLERLGILHQIFRLPDDDRETGVKPRYMLLRLATRLAEYRRPIIPAEYTNSFLHLYLAQLAEKAFRKDVFSIPIPGSCNVLGLTDDYQILGKEEIFVRAQGQIMCGVVLVYRNPIIHIGDIQTANAVNKDRLRKRMEEAGRPDVEIREVIDALLDMDNIVFFSQWDVPPLPNRLSGGDLDGDRFEIIPTGCPIWQDAQYRIEHPAPYEDGVSGARDKSINPFDINEVAKFVTEYIGNDCFDVLQDHLMCLADLRPRGMNDEDVKRMAVWLSRAVDYAKSGQKVDLFKDILRKEEFQTHAKPDFLRAFGSMSYHNFGGEYYRSERLLGRLYREFEGLRYDAPQGTIIDNTNIRARVGEAWQDWFQEEWTNNEGHAELERHFQNLHVTVDGTDRIRAIREEIRMEQVDDPDYLRVKDFVREELDHYRNFRDRETVSGNSELDLFLGKKIRNFPMRFIRNLFQKISKHLSGLGFVEFTDASLNQVKCLRRMTPSAVELVYKRCLFLAWDVAIEQSASAGGDGQGYAFICLYALLCHNWKIVAN